MRIKANSTKAKRIKVEGFYQFCLHGKEIKAGKGFNTAVLVCLLDQRKQPANYTKGQPAIKEKDSQQIKEKTAEKAGKVFQISK
jgi:hypothetical protein